MGKICDLSSIHQNHKYQPWIFWASLIKFFTPSGILGNGCALGTGCHLDRNDWDAIEGAKRMLDPGVKENKFDVGKKLVSAFLQKTI
jgi:hypothetical protein